MPIIKYLTLKLQHIYFSASIFVVLSFFSISCVKESVGEYVTDTVRIAKIYQPDGLIGKDATIESVTPDSCFGNSSHLAIFSWTNGGVFNTARTYIEFNLSDIAPLTKIKAAKLSLYWISYGNFSEHTGDNAFYIYRVTQTWEEASINWNNQPLTSDLNSVTVPKSRQANQSYTNIDVTKLVQDMIDNPNVSHGFMLKLDEEFPFRLVILASSDYTERSKRPKLEVYY